MANRQERAAVRLLVARVIAAHKANGYGPECELMAWLRDPAREETPGGADAVRAEMVAREDWPPKASADGLVEVARLFPDDQAHRERLQLIYARAMAEKPWRYARGELERLLAEKGEYLEAAPTAVLVEALAANHPNPKAFLAQDHVRARLHPEIDFTDLPAPDFRHIERHEMAGLRGVELRQDPPMRGRSRPMRPA